MATWDLICADVERAWGRQLPTGGLSRILRVLACAGSVRGAATIGFRLAHAVGRVWPLGGAMIKQVNQVVTGCDIAYQARIGPGLRLLHPTGVVIAPRVVAGACLTVHSGVTLGQQPNGAPSIGDNVNLAPGARIFGPVVVGDRVRVAANAVVTKTIEGNDLVLGGVPARVLRPIRPEETAAPEAS